MFKTLGTALAMIFLRLWRWVKMTAVILVVVWATVVAFDIDNKVDSICVEGRLSARQAEVINQRLWARCPQYRDGQCQAESQDRVVVRECSETLKLLWHPSHWWRTLRSGEFPWQ